jgi:putative phosphoribosyl transferase
MSKTQRTFQDRHEAGRILAGDIVRLFRLDDDDVVVLGLARGGIPVGWEVAASLHAPLDVCLVRKLGVPQWPELAMGALASGGGVVLNDDLVQRLAITEAQVREAVTREIAELHRREQAYRADRDALDVTGKTVVLVDDGIATGASMIAAVRSVRESGPARIVVAVPVGPASVCRRLRSESADVVCSTMPADFGAVGQVFADFHQVTDHEVRALLAAATR